MKKINVYCGETENNRCDRETHPVTLFNKAKEYVEFAMVGYEDEMINHCIGTIPELFDGNPPFNGRGAISFAMNVAEILRTLELLEKYNFK